MRAAGWIAACALAACASAARPLELPRAPRGDTIEPGDRLAIRVEAEPDLDATVFVQPDDSVHLASLGDVPGDGTTLGLSRAIAERLAERHEVPPQVLVVVVEHAYRVYVIGAVMHPGVVRYEEGMTLVGALVRTGGFTREADASRVSIQRRYGRDLARSGFVSVEAITEGEIPDVPLDPGDVIRVDERAR